MGLFFNRKKKEKTSKTAAPRKQVGRKLYEEGKITKEDICEVDSHSLMLSCDIYFRTKEEFEEQIPDNNLSRQNVINAFNEGRQEDRFVKMLSEIVKEHPEQIKRNLIIRNQYIVGDFKLLDVLAEINEFDSSITVDYIMDMFYSNEEWQQKYATSGSSHKLRTREEFNEYLEVLYRCNTQAENGHKICNDDFLLIDENGELLEPDWYGQLIPLPENV